MVCGNFLTSGGSCQLEFGHEGSCSQEPETIETVVVTVPYLPTNQSAHQMLDNFKKVFAQIPKEDMADAILFVVGNVSPEEIAIAAVGAFDDDELYGLHESLKQVEIETN